MHSDQLSHSPARPFSARLAFGGASTSRDEVVIGERPLGPSKPSFSTPFLSPSGDWEGPPEAYKQARFNSWFPRIEQAHGISLQASSSGRTSALHAESVGSSPTALQISLATRLLESLSRKGAPPRNLVVGRATRASGRYGGRPQGSSQAQPCHSPSARGRTGRSLQALEGSTPWSSTLSAHPIWAHRRSLPG